MGRCKALDAQCEQLDNMQVKIERLKELIYKAMVELQAVVAQLQSELNRKDKP